MKEGKREGEEGGRKGRREGERKGEEGGREGEEGGREERGGGKRTPSRESPKDIFKPRKHHVKRLSSSQVLPAG